MPKTVSLDFDSTPPAQGGGLTDLIPPGTYVLEIRDSDNAPTAKGAPMATINFVVASGKQSGKRLIDRFVFPKTSEDKIFGAQRFHALLVGVQGKPLTGKKSIDLDKLKGKKVIGEVIDDELPAKTVNGTTYAARPISKPVAYYHVANEEWKEKASITEKVSPATREQPKPVTAPAPAAQATAVVEVPADDELFGGEEEDTLADTNEEAVDVADAPADAAEDDDLFT